MFLLRIYFIAVIAVVVTASATRKKRFAELYVADPYAYSYAALLKNYLDGDVVRFCNAAILSSMVAITSADCIASKNLTLVSGTTDLIKDNKRVWETEIERVVVHPEYTGSYTMSKLDGYNVALLIFKRAITIGNKPIKFRKKTITYWPIQDKIALPATPVVIEDGTILSWGLTRTATQEERVYMATAKLRSELMTGLIEDDCRLIYPHMHENNFCARTINVDTGICAEERGGLFIKEKDDGATVPASSIQKKIDKVPVPAILTKGPVLLGLLSYATPICRVQINETYIFTRMDVIYPWVQSILDTVKPVL